MNIYGYIHVSSRDQNEDRQMIALKELRIPEKHIYMDKQPAEGIAAAEACNIPVEIFYGKARKFEKVD